jgi:hypothetical protein
MGRDLTVTYTKRYYKSITRTINIPGTLGDNEIDEYLENNFPKEEVADASLRLEDEEFDISEF